MVWRPPDTPRDLVSLRGLDGPSWVHPQIPQGPPLGRAPRDLLTKTPPSGNSPRDPLSGALGHPQGPYPQETPSRTTHELPVRPLTEHPQGPLGDPSPQGLPSGTDRDAPLGPAPGAPPSDPQGPPLGPCKGRRDLSISPPPEEPPTLHSPEALRPPQDQARSGRSPDPPRTTPPLDLSPSTAQDQGTPRAPWGSPSTRNIPQSRDTN